MENGAKQGQVGVRKWSRPVPHPSDRINSGRNIVRYRAKQAGEYSQEIDGRCHITLLP